LRKNKHLIREGSSPWATEDQYALFKQYLASRHYDGGMADMDIFEFAAMVEETPVRSRVVEYRSLGTEEAPDPELSAVCLTDVLSDGLSMVYSFFDPALAMNSLGTYVILDHIEMAKSAGLPYVYLGYWVPGSPKMDYKARFKPLEIYRGREWTLLEDPNAIPKEQQEKLKDPISEQVAAIHLPETDR
jgi:arginine-tRNA-protein transferase